MNKLLTKIVGVVLGTTMAVGVGVGVAVNSERANVDSQVNAASITGTTTAPTDATYHHAFASGDFSTTAQPSKSLSDSNGGQAIVWSISAATFVNGVQIGSGNNPQTSDFVISTSVGVADTALANKRVTKMAIGMRNASSGGFSGSFSNNDTFAEQTTTTTYYVSNSMDVTTGTISFTVKSTKSKAIYLNHIYVWYENASTNPEVSLAYTGSSKVMLNKDGSAVSVTGLSASSSNIANPVYKWEIVNASDTEMATISGTGATPTMSVSKVGTLEVKVSARKSADSDIPANYTACASNVSIEVVNFGGQLSWTKRTSMVFKEGLGFDISSTTIKMTMADDSIVDYGGDYSSFDIYMGDTADSVTKVTSSTIASITSASDLNGKFYKIIDTSREIGSTATEVATVVFTAKATFTLSSVANVTEITKNQTIYLKTDVISGWGDAITFSTESSLITVDSSTGVITSGNSSSDNNIVVTATMENGNSQDFTMKVLASKTYDISEAYDMASGFNTTAEDVYYGSTSQTYTVKGYFITQESNNSTWECIADDPTNPTKVLKLYECENNSGTDVSAMVTGGLITATGTLNDYKHGGNYYLCDGTIDAYTSPAAESIEISGPTEVYINESINLSIVNVSPDGATTDVTWTTDDENHSVVIGGEFTADKSGVYTVTATSTSEQQGGTHASDTHEIHVFEFQEVVVGKKANPKTTYYVGQAVENDLLTASVKYKCGSTLNYKSEDVTATVSSVSYKYNNSALSNGVFASKNESGATLEVVDLVVTSSIYPDDDGVIMVEPEGISVANVVVYSVEVDLANTTITPTKTAFKFGDEFTHAGTIHIAYKNGYAARDVALDSNDVAVDEPNMMQLGTQNLKVYVDDSEHSGDALLEVGSYNITITNVGAESNAGGSSEQNLETSTTSTNLSENSEQKKSLSASISNVNSVTISLDAQVTGTSGTTYTHKVTFKLYDSNDSLVATSSEISVATKPTSSATWSTTFEFNSSVEVAKASYTLTTRQSGSNLRQRSFDITVVNTTPDFDQNQAIAYAKYFNSEIGGLCDAGGDTSAANVTAISGKWSTLKTEYLAMTKDAKDYFADHTSQEDIARTIGMYTKIVERYELENFMVDGDGNKVVEPTNSLTLGGIASNTSVVATVIIISVISLSTLCGYFLLRKRKEER